MFFSANQIGEAIKKLENVHPFFGITFLVFKLGRLPVGDRVHFPINVEEQKFLDEYFKPYEDSSYYFRLFRVSDKSRLWLESKYPFAGSQSTRTRKFGNAFIHEKNTDIWGWKEDYVKILKLHLHRNKPVPAFYMAVWLYRKRDWSSDTTADYILDKFFSDFRISEAEKSELFDVSLPSNLDRDVLLQSEMVLWTQLQDTLALNPPPDLPPDEGGTLSYLEIRGVGPAKELKFEPAERINLITGDNGLGKSFILECAWWALSGNWTSSPIYPSPDVREDEPVITFQISGDSRRPEKIETSYDWEKQDWPFPEGRPLIPGLLIYARVDGAFAVWDPARDYWTSPIGTGNVRSNPLVFSREEVWNGLQVESGGKTRFLINGLIDDWIVWQSRQETSPFSTLTKVLRRLSPPDQSDLGPLEPDDPVRIPGDSRLIPSIRHSYGRVPLIQASAGVRRIVAMSYLIVWAWEEHKTQSKLIRKEPQTRMVILIDEIEAHLHPQWQRVILPSLLDIREDLQASVQIQFLIATHSPLVMASMEPKFDVSKDKIFHLNVVKEGLFGGDVILEERDFILYGPVDSWLQSDIFELHHARSIEAEKAIEEAISLQMKEGVTTEEVREVSERLLKCLAGDDNFWPRWMYFAEQHGIEL